jgi:hypothetical protein
MVCCAWHMQGTKAKAKAKAEVKVKVEGVVMDLID